MVFFIFSKQKMNENHLSRLHLSLRIFFFSLSLSLSPLSLVPDYLVIRDINQEIDLERVESAVINTSRAVSDRLGTGIYMCVCRFA